MRSTLTNVLAFVCAATLWAPVLTQAAEQNPQQPNVVFILADNVGYGDLGSYGGGELRGAPTPRLDQLAREGLRLTQFLVEPACTPSRAALMTGQYSIRNGLSLIAIAGSPYHASRRRLHDGSAVQGCRLRHGNLREVAPRQRTAEPADGARLRRVLRHSAGHLLGRGDIRQHDRADALDPCAARRAAGAGSADRRGDGRRATADREALHAGGARRDRQRARRQVDRLHAAAEGGREAILPLPAVLHGARARTCPRRSSRESRGSATMATS